MVIPKQDIKAGSPQQISEDDDEVEEMVNPFSLRANPRGVAPHTVFDVHGKKIKRHHTPPLKVSGQLVPGSTDGRLIIGDYGVSRKRPNRIEYAHKPVATKNRI